LRLIYCIEVLHVRSHPITTSHSPKSGNSSKLGYLDLDSNEVGDISALSGLNKLKILLLSGNQITDINALIGLISLEKLFLTYNQIVDISSLVASSHPEIGFFWDQNVDAGFTPALKPSSDAVLSAGINPAPTCQC
jgi:Leucine-rich repeat (LRR) protein